MEIADIFVVNKSDRPDADLFVKNLRLMLAPAFQKHSYLIPVIKTVANARIEIEELYTAIKKHQTSEVDKRKVWLLTEQAFQLIQKSRMNNINKNENPIMRSLHEPERIQY